MSGETKITQLIKKAKELMAKGKVKEYIQALVHIEEARRLQGAV